MAGDGAVIIKRIKKSGHGEHHGGQWKVAYADFVTAMMAFFLLMWLINTTTPEQKRGIADYFAPQSISQTSSGAGGVLGGRVIGQNGSEAGNIVPVKQKQKNQASSAPSHAREDSKERGGLAEAVGKAPASQTQSDDHLERAVQSAQDEAFESAAESIRQAMQEMPDIAALSRQVMVEQTPEGLRIQLVDQDGRPMFQPGTAEPMPYTRRLLAAVAKVIDRLPNRISISGHTDGKPFTGTNGMTNWELSAQRANAARALMTGAGLNSDRIYEVAGKAGSEPLLPEDPLASENRRISILLMREAPPVPPGRKL
ncbi:MAG TPA: flagellar motor protein MotB [Rhizomicrobium sp.]|nr:flagellar motor protein MotB [Rhizomicrobium sp.]